MSNPFTQSDNENGFVMNDEFASTSANSAQETNFADFSNSQATDFNQEVNFASTPVDEENKKQKKSKNTENNENESEKKEYEWYHFYKSEFYQRWFDIEFFDVLKRMLWGLIPFFGNFFDNVSANPDLYGPIWIPVTVIFLSFFSGSLTSMLVGDYDYLKLTIIAGTVLVYIIFVPFIIGLICKIGFKVKEKMSSFYCLFGYSYTIYIIVIPLCAIPYWYVQIPLVCVGCFIMTLTLLKNLFQYMKNNSKITFAVVTLVILTIINLAVAALMIYAVWPSETPAPATA